MIRFRREALAFMTLTCLIAATQNARAADALIGDHACRPGEHWDFNGAIPDQFADSFKQFLSKKMPTVRGFSEGLALRRQAADPAQKYFAEYWVARSLYGSKMVHIAKEGFAVLAARTVTDSTIGAQLGALACLTEIHGRFPAIDLPKSVIARIPDYLAAAKKVSRSETVWDFVTLYAVSAIGRPSLSAGDTDEILSWLEGSGPYESLVRGLLASRKYDHSTAVHELTDFLNDSRPDALERYVDTAELLVARSLYSLGRYDAAITHFKKVSKSSNELTMSLEELSWAYLMAERYREAIGTAMNLQVGGLRKTYAPEAPMVMAMAMNEICQYPDSVNAANIFRKNYSKSFKWLESWSQSGESQNLYKLAVNYIRRQPGAPDRVASEWVRSPLFISDQDEINLLFDERDSASSLTQWGSREQNRLAQSILSNLKDLKPRFHEAQAKRKPGESLPSGIQKDLQRLKEDLIAFHRMQKAAPSWKAVLARHQAKAPALEARLADDINSDLKLRSARMYTQLQEIVENVQLIEVEIYNGASEDIIWQNAHPEYKKMAKDLDDDPDRQPASKVWDWGHTKVATDGDDVEVWEDELGSFKANLLDNCASKDKYLRIRMKKGMNASR